MGERDLENGAGQDGTSPIRDGFIPSGEFAITRIEALIKVAATRFHLARPPAGTFPLRSGQWVSFNTFPLILVRICRVGEGSVDIWKQEWTRVNPPALFPRSISAPASMHRFRQREAGPGIWTMME